MNYWVICHNCWLTRVTQSSTYKIGFVSIGLAEDSIEHLSKVCYRNIKRFGLLFNGKTLGLFLFSVFYDPTLIYVLVLL